MMKLNDFAFLDSWYRTFKPQGILVLLLTNEYNVYLLLFLIRCYSKPVVWDKLAH